MIRNFYIKASVDGRKTPLTGGSKSKDGGFLLTIHQRKDGESIKVIEIEGFVSKNDQLNTRIISSAVCEVIATKR